MDASAVFVLLVLPGALAGPLSMQAGNHEACATRCPESNNFAYKPDTTYAYRYEVETRTTMTGAAEDTATIQISATALVESFGNCEMALRLTEVSIKRSHEQNPRRMVGADDMSRARQALEDQPLRFAFYDGAVGELCPSDNEDLWALNIKRGVLTSFQNSMRQRDRDEQVQEVDVTGQCPTHYKVTQKGWKTLTINKVKDVLSCTDRHGHRTSVLSTPYRSPNSMQSLPLMKSSHECHHDISQDGILQASTCSEVHVFRPFSKSSSGASTETSQKLTYIRDSRGVSTRTGSVSRRTTLLFEHKPGHPVTDSNTQGVLNKLDEICTVSQVDIRPEVPHMFGELVHLMRDLDYSDLGDVNRQIEQGRICSGNADKAKKFFRDALPVTATGASVLVMGDLLNSEKFEDAQVTFWLTSLAFVPNPTKDMVYAVRSFLTNEKIKMDALLPASALVNNYCESNPDCAQDTEVQEVLNKLTDTLGYDCKVNDKNLEEVLLTMRAIGNIGRSEAVTLNLEPCFTNSEVPMDVRVAAVDAYRRLPCSADRNNLMEIFLRQKEDSELRIAAYLAVMKCPTESVLRQVRQALTKEEVNQVGSFVWTHLTNLLETDSPHKQEIRDVLENELLQQEFRKDRRKYSRNYELSFFSEKFNLGGVYENNLIWSAKSFLPRSAMVNLTVDMFGRSVNLLEVGGRVQGLEYLLEGLFGPSSKDTGNAAGYGNTDVVKDAKLARTKRNFGDIKDDLRAQMYLRVFGNELAFKGMDADTVAKWKNRDKKKSLMDEVLEKLAKNEEISFTQSAMFLDSSMVIPTAAGLPLNLTVNGSASVELKASGKLDFTKISSKSQSFEIAADIQPSGAVELSSMMSVDAFVTKVGLKMTSRLHTSTAFKGRVELARGQTFSVEIDTPRDTQEIMDFQSKFFIVHDGYAKEQLMVTNNRKTMTKCSGEPLAKILGLELCASLSFPNATLDLDAPYFPFTGPTAVSVTLRKHDVHSGYRLLTKQVMNDNSAILQIAMDTPGSKIDRAVSFGYVANLKDYALEAELLSPWKKATLNLAADNSKKTTKASGKLTVDKDQEYSVQFDLDKDIRDNSKVKLKPGLLVSSHKGNHLSFGGELDYRRDKMLKLSKFQLVMGDVLKKPISLDFVLNQRQRKDKMRYKSNVKFSSQWASLKSSSNVLVGSFNGNKRTAVLLTKTRMDYTVPAIPAIKRNSLTMGFKLHDRSTKSFSKYGFNLNLDAKQTPDWNVLMNGEVSHKKTLTELDVNIRHGKNVKVKSDTSKEIQIAGFVSHNVKDDKAVVKFDLKTLYPEKNIEYQITGKHEHDKKSAEQYLSIRYAKGKSIDAHMRLAEQKKQRTATFDLSYPGREIKVNADLIEKSRQHYVLTGMVQPQKGEKNSIVISYERLSRDSLAIASELYVHNRPPAFLELTADYKEREMRGKGQLQWENKNYSMELASDIEKDKYVKWFMDIVHPERKIAVRIEGGKDVEEEVKRAVFDVQWDALKDPTKRVGLTVEFADQAQPEDFNVGGMVEVFTPTKSYHQLKADLKLQNTAKRFLTLAEAILGEKSKEYSLKLQLKKPVSGENFDAVAWLKSPHNPVRHVEVSAQHSFSRSGQLSTAVKGVFNQHFAEVKLEGSDKGNLVRRFYEGTASLTSSFDGARDVQLMFSHNDDGRKYFAQAVMNHEGDQYSASMDTTFVKVHWQISTDGSVEIRAPQLQHPVKLSWQHNNNLHELTSTATVSWESDKRAKLDVTGTVNVVEKIFDLEMTHVGPWKEDGRDYQASLKVHYDDHGSGSMDLSTLLKLDQDQYSYEVTTRGSDSSYTSTHSYAFTNPPVRARMTYSIQFKDFPITASLDMTLDKKSVLNVNVEVENPREDSYTSNVRFALDFENITESVVAKVRHDKRKGRWVTRGDISYRVGKKIDFEAIVNVERGNEKMVKFSLNTPYDQISNIDFEYSHQGDVEGEFTAKASLEADPIFDTISSEVSWNNRRKFTGRFRLDTPFKELRYLEVNTNSEPAEGSKRRSYLKVDYHPRQVYEADMLYTFNFPTEADLTLNVTTPRKELPSMSTEIGYQYTDDEVSGRVKFNGPSFKFDGFSSNFGTKRGDKSVSSRFNAFFPPQKKWAGSADISWANEIQGTVNMESNVEGAPPTQLELSHRGYTWRDFHTKAGFRMNGDRLESEVAYMDQSTERNGLLVLATPDPDLQYVKTTFYERLADDTFEFRWTGQYGETSKPYEYAAKTTYSENEIGFATELKTPFTEDLEIELGFESRRQVLAKVHGVYGERNNIDMLVKYKILESLWDVGSEFGYKIHGSGHNIGLTFRKEGDVDNLSAQSTMKYMGREVTVDTTYRDTGTKSGRVSVRTNFEGYTDLGASFEHNGDLDKFDTKAYLKFMDDKEVQGSMDFERVRSRRVSANVILKLPVAEYAENKLTYKHNYRRNRLSAEAVLTLGAAQPIKGEIQFIDDSTMTVTVTGSHKDFDSFTATAKYDERTMRLDGNATLRLVSQRRPITATYLVQWESWPWMVNVRADTPYRDWEVTELTVTHDGMLDAFTTSTTLQARAVGKVTSEATWSYKTPTNFEGMWTFSSAIDGAKDLKLVVKNSQNQPDEYSSHVEIGWELLKQIVLDGTLRMVPGDVTSRYGGSLSMTTPFQQVSDVGFTFDHSHSEQKIVDTAMVTYNQKTYLDTDFEYSIENGRKRVGSIDFREPHPMAYTISGFYGDQEMEGELKLNWDKRSPMKNVQLTGEYSDRSDSLGTDRNLKVWAMHPARTMGLEHAYRISDTEFHSDAMLTWDKDAGHTLHYDVSWNDRSSRYSTSYDAMVKVGCPVNTVKAEGVYSDTGRVRGARGSLMWDADRSEDKKIGLSAELDTRGQTNRLQLDLDLPFVDKRYGYVLEGAVMSGNTIIQQRTEFSYSDDPRKLLVISSSIQDISYGSDASNYSVTFGVTHPITDVSFQVTSHFGVSEVLGTMATEVVYMTADRQKKNLELRGQIDKLRKTMLAELKSPIKDVSLEGTMTGDTNYNLKLISNEDGQRSQVTDVFVDPKTRTFELKYFYDKNEPSKTLNVFGHMLDDRMVQTEVYSMQGGKRVSETLMTLRLNSSHVLHTRLNWRPRMLTELQQYLSTQLTVFSYASSETFSAAARAVGQEVEAKYNTIMNEIKEEAGPLFEQLQREMTAIQNRLDNIHRDVRRFYGRNALNVQDMGQMVNAAFNQLITGTRMVAEQFRQFYEQAQAELAQSVQELGRYPMAQKYAQLVHDFASGLKSTRVVLEQALDQLSLKVQELSDQSYRRYLYVSRQIERKLQGYTAALQQTTIGKVYTGLSQLSNSDVKKIREVANEKMLLALEKLGLKETYLDLTNKIRQILTDQYSDLVQRPEFQQIYIISSEIYQQGIWAYQYWHVEQNLQMAAAQILELAKDVALLEITRIKNAVVDLDKSRVIVYDPANGELQFEIYLPVALKSLAEPPDVRLTKYVNRVKAWFSTYVPSPRHSLWTSINNYMPNMDATSWMPPYRANAFVMGDSHVVTFDRSHYDFAGRCSYVLARDMTDDRFTVVLNYNNRPRRPQVESLVVLLRGVAIEVDKDSKVKVNDKVTELPFFSGSISAVRQQNVIKIQDRDDVIVDIDPERGIYSIGISGWYHGRTAGLLGTYDNEPFNDLTDSNHEIVDDVEDFANSWEVSSRYCRSRNLAEISGLDATEPEVQACVKHLNDTSSYYTPCFGQVDADKLVRVCVDYAKSGMSVQEAKCKAGQQYRYMCQRRGVVLGSPPECIVCDLPGDKQVTAGASWERKTGEEVKPEVFSTDVVFVVEDGGCNDWARKTLSRTATELGQALVKQGLKDNRFGLLSFLGDEQFVHTIEGEVFGQTSSFLKATESLRLTENVSDANVVSALQEAMKYPYRVGVAKLLVLVPCSTCAGGDVHELGQVLLSNGFLLHVINEQNFKAPGADNRSPVPIFGVDRSSVYTLKSARRNSDTLFQQMRLPADACTQLALHTNGSVFDVVHMRERDRVQSEFLEAFAARGAQTAVPPSCQICSCHDDGTGRGHTVCQLCNDHSWLWNYIPTWLQQSSTSVMGVFNDLHHRIITSLALPEPEVSMAA